MADIWAQAMGIDRIGVEDRFLDLGGDSLMAAVIFSEIEAKLGAQLPMAVVDQAPTIADLASRIDAFLAQRPSTSGSSESSHAPTRGASAS
ncbi:MAG TPA: phosphopantetheine-binding protein [Stellaceae bacterium]|nr:phosphopantetheine-binding protein [Stellaceae bacterium]